MRVLWAFQLALLMSLAMGSSAAEVAYQHPNLTIVARASRRQTRHALEKAGADHVISPYELSGRRMASRSGFSPFSTFSS